MYQRVMKRGVAGVMSMLGPTAVAGAHFAVSAALIPHVAPADFGTFAFAMVVLQVATGISDGLIGSPMAVTVRGVGSTEIKTFEAINIIYCLAVLATSTVILLTFVDLNQALQLSAFISIMAFRWFCRAALIQQERKARVWLADLIYSGTALLLVIGLLLADGVSLVAVTSCLLASAMVTMPFLLWGRHQDHTGFKVLAALRNFMPVWREHARWSLLGVGANAVTIEAHVFIVSFLAGPEAFAPVAVAALFYRPTLIGIYSIAQVERPKLARLVTEKGARPAVREMRMFIAILALLWLGNSIIASIVLYYAGHMISGKYDVFVVAQCTALLGGVMLLRSLRHPFLVFMQAAHQFRPIAMLTGAVAPISLASTALGLYIIGVGGAIAGLLFADLLLFFGVYSLFKRRFDALNMPADVLGRTSM